MAKNIVIKDRNVKIQIYDNAGSEAYRSITRAYYKGSACTFIVYDITEKKHFMMLHLGFKIVEICVLRYFNIFNRK